LIKKLKELVNNSYSFQNIVAQRAIDELKEFFKDGDQDLSIYIADFLIEKTKNNNNYYIRASTTAALGKF
jgi:hypothetical protein